MAAAAFHAGRSRIGEIATAYESLTPLLGAAAAGTFLFALLASGMSSSVVGTMAGRSSCKALSASVSRCGCAAWPPCRRPLSLGWGDPTEEHRDVQQVRGSRSTRTECPESVRTLFLSVGTYRSTASH